MSYQFLRTLVTTILAVAVTGCASQGGRSGSGIDPFCAAVGGVIGGGSAAIISVAAGPIGAGVGLGAVLGALACHQRGQESATVATTSTAVTPPPLVVAQTVQSDSDSDGDGVVDRIDRCPGTVAGAKVDANGCPALLLTLTGINFKFDSAVIEDSSSEILDRAVATLNATHDVALRIEGHCDSTGSDAYNLKLSERRAAAVQNYLVQHGVAPERLTTAGLGEAQPVAPNETEAGRYQNRRVEFHVAGEAAVSSHGDDAAGKADDQPLSTR